MTVWAIALALWGTFTYALHKRGLSYFCFLVGSIGTFIFSICLCRGVLYHTTVTILMTLLSAIGNVTHSFSSFVSASTITVFHNADSLSFFVSYECSGVIEFLVFASLLLFFPMYKVSEKIKYLVIGYFFILFSNASRLLFIIYSARIFGNSSFFMSHMIIGRLIYFGLIIALYYTVFTKPHVKFRKGKGAHAK